MGQISVRPIFFAKSQLYWQQINLPQVPSKSLALKIRKISWMGQSYKFHDIFYCAKSAIFVYTFTGLQQSTFCKLIIIQKANPSV
jgi:hypothetical protein